MNDMRSIRSALKWSRPILDSFFTSMQLIHLSFAVLLILLPLSLAGSGKHRDDTPYTDYTEYLKRNRLGIRRTLIPHSIDNILDNPSNDEEESLMVNGIVMTPNAIGDYMKRKWDIFGDNEKMRFMSYLNIPSEVSVTRDNHDQIAESWNDKRFILGVPVLKGGK